MFSRFIRFPCVVCSKERKDFFSFNKIVKFEIEFEWCVLCPRVLGKKPYYYPNFLMHESWVFFNFYFVFCLHFMIFVWVFRFLLLVFYWNKTLSHLFSFELFASYFTVNFQVFFMNEMRRQVGDEIKFCAIKRHSKVWLWQVCSFRSYRDL